MVKDRLYRHYKLNLSEPVGNTFKVNILEDIRKIVLSDDLKGCFFRNIRIENKPYYDERLGEEWNPFYFVISDIDGFEGQCVGICNFIE